MAIANVVQKAGYACSSKVFFWISIQKKYTCRLMLLRLALFTKSYTSMILPAQISANYFRTRTQETKSDCCPPSCGGRPAVGENRLVQVCLGLWCAMLCFVDLRARKIRTDASSCPRTFLSFFRTFQVSRTFTVFVRLLYDQFHRTRDKMRIEGSD